jgi:dynein heavy chain
MGWRPLCQSWLHHRLPGSVTPEQRARLQELFEWLVDPCIAYVRKHCKCVRQLGLH